MTALDWPEWAVRQREPAGIAIAWVQARTPPPRPASPTYSAAAAAGGLQIPTQTYTISGVGLNTDDPRQDRRTAKKRIALIAAATMLYASASPAQQDVGTAAQELKDNCVACCLAARQSVTDTLRLNETKCVTTCGFFVSHIVELIDQD